MKRCYVKPDVEKLDFSLAGLMDDGYNVSKTDDNEIGGEDAVAKGWQVGFVDDDDDIE